LLVSPVNLLCVDEPTNHLDMWSRDVLEEALQEYQGNIVLITHDRHLIRSVADRIVEVVDGRATVFPGDYAYYLSKREPEVDARVAEPGPGQQDDAPRASGPKTKEQKRREAEERNRFTVIRQRVRKIESQLETLGGEIKELEETFAAPDVYSSGADVADLTRRYEAAKRKAARLEAEWADAMQTLEAEGAEG
jgi:ATP-binding cassette subfamily F protein 3